MEEYLNDVQIGKFVEDYLMHFSLVKNHPFIGPEFLQFIITNKCPLRCKMCDVWRLNITNDEITTDEVKKGIDQAIELDKKIGGLKEIYFTGGEALLRSDIFELIKYANSKHKISTFNTSGVLITKDIARKIVESKLHSLTFSIDGPNAKIHDFFRGKGTFEKAERAIRLVQKAKKKMKSKVPRIGVFTVIMQQNVNHLSEMVKFALRHRIRYLGFQPYVYNGNLSKKAKTKFWIPPEKLPVLKRELEKLKKFRYELNKNQGVIKIDLFEDKVYNYFLKKNYADKCYAGFSRMIVYKKRICFVCNGPGKLEFNHIGLCPEYPLDKAWFSDKADYLRNNVKTCKKSCIQFCSARPSSDRFFDVHKRLICLFDREVLNKESKFLKKYMFKINAIYFLKILLVLATNPIISLPRCLEFLKTRRNDKW